MSERLQQRSEDEVTKHVAHINSRPTLWMFGTKPTMSQNCQFVNKCSSPDTLKADGQTNGQTGQQRRCRGIVARGRSGEWLSTWTKFYQFEVCRIEFPQPSRSLMASLVMSNLSQYPSLLIIPPTSPPHHCWLYCSWQSAGSEILYHPPIRVNRRKTLRFY